MISRPAVKVLAAFYSFTGQEYLPVLIPRHHFFRRPADQFDDARLGFRLAEPACQLFVVKPMIAFHFLNKFAYVRSFDVEGTSRRNQRQEDNKNGETKTDFVRSGER